MLENKEIISLFGFTVTFKMFLTFSFLVIIYKVMQAIFSRPSLHKLKFYIKYGFYHVFVMCVTGLAVLPCLFRPANADNIVFAKIFYHLLQMPRLFGIKIITTGKENMQKAQKPVIFMCNHQSSLDVFPTVQEAPRPTAVIAKRELLKVPIFGFATWLCGTIFIDRKDRSEAVNIMKDAAAKLKANKTNVWIFPEGTRQQIDDVAPLKKGGFHLAVQAQIPIVPVVVGNCRNFLDVPNKIFNSGVMRVRILPSIPTEGLTKDDIPELTSKCHKIMSEAYHQISKDHQDEYANLKPLPVKTKTN